MKRTAVDTKASRVFLSKLAQIEANSSGAFVPPPEWMSGTVRQTTVRISNRTGTARSLSLQGCLVAVPCHEHVCRSLVVAS